MSQNYLHPTSINFLTSITINTTLQCFSKPESSKREKKHHFQSCKNMAKTLIIKSIFFIAYLALIHFISLSKSTPLTEPITASGFTFDLIHRDSPESPSYNPSFSPSQRLANAIRRSFIRIQLFNTKIFKKLPETDVINVSGEYFLRYSIGTPPIPSLGIMDTGSDLIWTQCQPCLKCFNQTLKIFTPKGSSTYRKIPCTTPRCSSFPGTTCSRTTKNCLYSETYGDQSFTQGELSMDTITLASSDRGKGVISVPNVVFGCGFRNGINLGGGESGIVGLGGGEISLVRQLGPLAQGKFSYCLVSFLSDKSTSKLSFGGNVVVSSRVGVSTPLVQAKPETFYYVTLEGISVGNERLELHGRERREGNIIVDSGTTLTMLPFDLYAKLRKALQSTIKLKQIQDPEGVLDLCFFTRRDDLRIPDIVVHFKGADVKWKQENFLVRTSEDSLCLAALPAQDIAIYGNLAQANFLVGYDLEQRTVSFKPTDCAV